jgi:hypothetical protein
MVSAADTKASAARSRAQAVHVLRTQGAGHWILTILTGISCGLMALAVNLAVEAIDTLRYRWTLYYIKSAGVLPPSHSPHPPHATAASTAAATAAVTLRQPATSLMHVCCMYGVHGAPHMPFFLSPFLPRCAACCAGGWLMPWLVFCLSGCCLAAIASATTVYLAPLAAGSGLPHIQAYCNGAVVPGLLVRWLRSGDVRPA